MVWGLSKKQNLVLGYLYGLKDTPESPPDPRLEVSLIASNLGMTQREVRRLLEKLAKGRYVRFFRFEGRSYYKILPRGIHKIEEHIEKATTWEISTRRIGIKQTRRES